MTNVYLIAVLVAAVLVASIYAYIPAKTASGGFSGSPDLVRIAKQFGDGTNDLYTGTITYHFTNVKAPGAWGIERLYLCDSLTGVDVGDSMAVTYSVEGGKLWVPFLPSTLVKISPFAVNLEGDQCTDLLASNSLGQKVALAGDQNHDIIIHLDETDLAPVQNDADGATIIFYEWGITSPQDISVVVAGFS